MKKNWILMLPLLIATAGMAQPGGPGGHQRHQAKAGHHQPFKNMALTPAQQTQARQLQEQLKKDLKALQQNEQITVKQQRDQREELLKNHRKAMQQMLTPAQQQQLAAQKASRQSMARHRSAIRLERMKTELQLTEAQVAALQAQHEKMQAGMEALRQNEQLDRVARHQQFESLRQEMKTGLEKVLTKEQMQQLKEKMPPRGDGNRFGPSRGRFMTR
jgi:hypothetical protein